MTNEEAIKILRDTPIDIRSTREDDILTLYATAQNMAIDALEESTWIPVGERLPEEDGWYQVTVQGYETVTDVSLYSADGSAWGDVSTKQKVTAWKPFPEPYKGGDKE